MSPISFISTAGKRELRSIPRIPWWNPRKFAAKNRISLRHLNALSVNQ